MWFPHLLLIFLSFSLLSLPNFSYWCFHVVAYVLFTSFISIHPGSVNSSVTPLSSSICILPSLSYVPFSLTFLIIPRFVLFFIFSTTRNSPILGLCTRMWIPFLFSPLNPPFLILHLKLPLVFPFLHVASLNLDFTSSLSRILDSHSLRWTLSLPFSFSIFPSLFFHYFFLYSSTSFHIPPFFFLTLSYRWVLCSCDCKRLFHVA